MCKTYTVMMILTMLRYSEVMCSRFKWKIVKNIRKCQKALYEKKCKYVQLRFLKILYTEQQINLILTSFDSISMSRGIIQIWGD